MKPFIFAGLIAFLSGAPFLKADFVSTVDSTNPLAFFELQSANGSSQVNGYTTSYVNGASESSPGFPGSNYAQLVASSQQYVSTSLSGGINTAGSIMAWVNLASLPSSSGSTFYIAGESQVGNDFDLQFQTDNNLYFYSAGGSEVSYTPTTTSLVGQWNMIVATYNATTNTQDIYWNGSLVATGSVGSNTNKTGAFWIGESSVFGGRYFNGGIDDVAAWNYDLSAAQVSAIYSSTQPTTPSTAPEPRSVLLLALGVPAVFWVGRGRNARRATHTSL